MRKYTILLSVLSLAACARQANEVLPRYEEEVAHAPKTLRVEEPAPIDEEKSETTVEAGGHTYTVSIHRRNLPGSWVEKMSILADDDDNLAEADRIIQPYNDSAIDVRVLRDGKDNYVHTFKKEDFASITGGEFLKAAVLHYVRFEGIDASTGTKRFMAGIFIPDSDVGDTIEVEVDSAATLRLALVEEEEEV